MSGITMFYGSEHKYDFVKADRFFLTDTQIDEEVFWHFPTCK